MWMCICVKIYVYRERKVFSKNKLRLTLLQQTNRQTQREFPPTLRIWSWNDAEVVWMCICVKIYVYVFLKWCLSNVNVYIYQKIFTERERPWTKRVWVKMSMWVYMCLLIGRLTLCQQTNRWTQQEFPPALRFWFFHLCFPKIMLLWICTFVKKLQTTDCRPWTKNYKLQIADCKLQITHYRSQNADYKLQTAHQGLQTADCSCCIVLGGLGSHFGVRLGLLEVHFGGLGASLDGLGGGWRSGAPWVQFGRLLGSIFSSILRLQDELKTTSTR